jgi:hypothetical protein
MNTWVIQIGNSDNKLTQQEWYAFVCDVDSILLSYATCTHFNGGSDSRAAWQNHCWVFQVDERNHDARILSELRGLCVRYNQDSIALIRGTTEFITPRTN